MYSGLKSNIIFFVTIFLVRSASANDSQVEKMFKHFETSAKAKIGQFVIPHREGLCPKGFSSEVANPVGAYSVICEKNGTSYTLRIKASNSSVTGYGLMFKDSSVKQFKCSDQTLPQKFMDKVEKTLVEDQIGKTFKYWGKLKTLKVFLFCTQQKNGEIGFLGAEYTEDK